MHSTCTVYFSAFFFFNHTTEHVWSQFLDQRLNPRPLHWKRGISTTGPPGKSINVLNFNSVPLYFIELICHVCPEREREILWLCSHRCRACESDYAMFWSTINRLLCNRHEPWNRQIKTKTILFKKSRQTPTIAMKIHNLCVFHFKINLRKYSKVITGQLCKSHWS